MYSMVDEGSGVVWGIEGPALGDGVGQGRRRVRMGDRVSGGKAVCERVGSDARGSNAVALR